MRLVGVIWFILPNKDLLKLMTHLTKDNVLNINATKSDWLPLHDMTHCLYIHIVFCLVFCLLIILFSVQIIMKNCDLIQSFKHTFLDMLAQMIIICFVFWTLDNKPFTLLYHPYLSYFSYLFIFDFQVIFLFKCS